MLVRKYFKQKILLKIFELPLSLRYRRQTDWAGRLPAAAQWEEAPGPEEGEEKDEEAEGAKVPTQRQR